MNTKRMKWLLAGACILALGAGITYPFVFSQDDWVYVASNENLQAGWSNIIPLALTPILGLSTPLPQISYLVDHSIGGLNPAVYHAFNLLWHIGMVLLVFRVFRELGIRRNPAFFTALIFALHPQRVESVVWISERKDVMCGFFFFLCCALFLARTRRRRPWGAGCWWGSLAAMAAALACKPSACALPFVLLAMDFHRTRKFRFKPVIWHFAVLGCYLILSHTLVTNTGNSALTGGLRIAMCLRNYCVYFLKTFYPAELYPIYPYISLSRLDYGIILACAAGLAWVIYRFRQKAVYDVLPMLFCGGIVLAPVSGIIIFSSADFADRYSYIPSVFFLAAAAMLLPKIPAQFQKLVWLYPALLLLRTWIYMPAWNGDENLLSTACSAPDYNYRAACSYSCLLARKGQITAGRKVLNNCGQQDPRTRQNMEQIELLDSMLALMERYHAGEDRARLFPEFTQKLDPLKNRKILHLLDYGSLIMFLPAHADCAMAAGKPRLAAVIYDTLAKSYPADKFISSFYAGVAQMLRKNPAGAIPYFEKACREKPEDENARRNLENARRLAAGRR